MSVAGACAASGAAAHVLTGELAEVLVVDGDDGHHLDRVRRIEAGERMTAADGRGGWRMYEVVTADRGVVTLEACGEADFESDVEPAIDVAPALTKAGLEVVVAVVSELGARALLPVLAERSVVRWDPARASKAMARLERRARESAMQCRRTRVLRIDAPQPLASVIGRPGLVVADRGGAAAAHVESGAELTILSGPEGGFSPEELDSLADVPRLGLGPYVVRAETAPIAAVAAVRGSR